MSVVQNIYLLWHTEGRNYPPKITRQLFKVHWIPISGMEARRFQKREPEMYTKQVNSLIRNITVGIPHSINKPTHFENL